MRSKTRRREAQTDPLIHFLLPKPSPPNDSRGRRSRSLSPSGGGGRQRQAPAAARDGSTGLDTGLDAARRKALWPPLFSRAELMAIDGGRFWAEFFSRGKPAPPSSLVRACVRGRRDVADGMGGRAYIWLTDQPTKSQTKHETIHRTPPSAASTAAPAASIPPGWTGRRT
jgi:hypothetical protein